MTFKHDNHHYRITFGYPDVPAGESRQTVCTISVAEPGANPPWTPLARDVRRTHPKDNFCKETGRKLALARAISSLPWDKDARRSAWTSYLNRRTETA